MNRAPPPRLPKVRYPGYEPAPSAPVIAPQGSPEVLTASQELYTQSVEWPMDVEVSVYTSRRPWRACDVYVIPTPMPTAGFFTVRTYAIVGGRRVLIASGRLGFLAAVAPNPETKWIVAARSVAAQFETTIQFTPVTVLGPFPVGEVQIAIAHSNEAVEPPPHVGAILPVASDTLMILNVVGPPAVLCPPELELVRISYSNNAGGTAAVPVPRWVHLHDVAQTVANPGGLQPAMSWPLGSVDGDGDVDTLVRYRVRDAMQIVVSSTSLLTTIVGDCIINPMVR